jgi:hypothetical protein
MFRKMLLASVASVGVLFPVAAGSADAHEFHRAYRHEHACRVYYRNGCDRGWMLAGRFFSRNQAERAAESYRCRGLEVFIR